jgi:hypothetical protein
MITCTGQSASAADKSFFRLSAISSDLALQPISKSVSSFSITATTSKSMRVATFRSFR